jgi:formate-dependent nitrite reductase membrane component NrfD
MIQEFSIGPRQNQEWRFAVAFSMSMEGMGAGLYLTASLLNAAGAALAGLVLVAVGAGVLLFDLGHPLRSWRVMAKAPTAWISQGAVGITGLLIFGLMNLALGRGTAWGPWPEFLSGLCALVVMLYPGLLLGSMASVPWWRQANLPAAYLLHSLASGLPLAVSIAVIAEHGAPPAARIISVLLTLLGAALFITWHQVREPSGHPVVRESLRLLREGPYRRWFLGGGVLVGLLLPLALAAAALLLHAAQPLFAAAILILAAGLRLLGDISYRYAVLKAGVWKPVL